MINVRFVIVYEFKYTNIMNNICEMFCSKKIFVSNVLIYNNRVVCVMLPKNCVVFTITVLNFKLG